MGSWKIGSLEVVWNLVFGSWNFVVPMMRQFFLKSQLLFEAIIVLATLGIVFMLISHYHYRWDMTREKVYSLPAATTEILKDLKGKRIEVLLFYSQEDPVRQGLEVFMRECQRYHPEFHYNFYDPNRRPRLARQFNIKQPSTLLIRSGDREERLFQPSEEDLSNAFLRILHPKDMDVCFVTGHGEAEIFGEENGFQQFREVIEGYNSKAYEIVLERDHVPAACQVVVVGGPRLEIKPEEFSDLKKAFENGKGVLLLIDPMDPGVGDSFENFAKEFGVLLGKNVLIDKSSRIAGGDFLMPLVSQYFIKHPVAKSMNQATFFPIVRTVQPSTEMPDTLEVIPLAMTASGTWAETDLPTLEKGEAAFDIKTDIAGPLPIAVAVEKKDGTRDSGLGTRKTEKIQQGTSPEEQAPHDRMVVVGDSDFLTNSYLNLSGNKDFGIKMIRWLGKDDRFIDVKRTELQFKPLLLGATKRAQFLMMILAFYPLAFFVLGVSYLILRSKTS